MSPHPEDAVCRSLAQTPQYCILTGNLSNKPQRRTGERLLTFDIILTKSLGLVLEPLEVSLNTGLVERSPSFVLDFLVLAHCVLVVDFAV